VLRGIKLTQNGREASTADSEAVKQRLQSSTAGWGFSVPFDARHFSEYHYVLAGANTVRFTGVSRDVHHGDGSFSVNAAGDVVRMVYAPSVLPDHATSGTITTERAEVLPSFWATTIETQHYDGRYGPFRGTGDIVSRESHFVRFASRSAALSALERGAI